ncbi:CYTH and CHAD domain-containing protein [Brucella anthropi]
MDEITSARRSTDKSRRPRAPVEIELKFGLRSKSRRALETAPEFSLSKPQRLHLLSTYYDTPDQALKKAGLTLRIRQNDRLRIQTVKAAVNASDVALRRDEWEWPIEQDAPDLARIATITGLAPIIERLKGRLEPVFVTDIRRTVHLLHLDDGSIVEVAIDTGKVICGDQKESIDELELELKKGSPRSLFSLAKSLHDQVPFWIFAESKAARGWRLRTGHYASARAATLPRLQSDDDEGEAFRKILRSSLGHLVVNIAPALRGDSEGLHQMRIALRACRAILEFFAPTLSRKSEKHLNRKLKHFVRKFGQTRDWDVLCTETIPAATAALPNDLDQIRERAETARNGSHKTLKKTLRGRAFTALVLSLATELSDAEDSSINIPDMKRPFTEIAPSLFDRIVTEISKRARHPGSLSANELHRLRKGLDRLYDDVTFVEALYSKHRLATYRARCEELQEILGLANDAVVTRRLIRELVKHGAGHSREPCDALVSWSKERRRKALHDLGRAVDGLRSASPFWR